VSSANKMYIPRTFDGNPGGGGCASDVDVVVVILEVVFSVVRSFCVDVVSESVVVNVCVVVDSVVVEVDDDDVVVEVLDDVAVVDVVDDVTVVDVVV